MSADKKLVGMIDLTPTWEGVLPLLIEIATQGATEKGRAEARAELQRMARIADSVAARKRDVP